LTFDGYVVGHNPDQIITVSNPDGVAVGISSIGMTGSTAFTFTHNCGTALAAGASCSVDVTFAPNAVGSYMGTLNVNEVAGTNHSVSLSGTAVTNN